MFHWSSRTHNNTTDTRAMLISSSPGSGGRQEIFLQLCIVLILLLNLNLELNQNHVLADEANDPGEPAFPTPFILTQTKLKIVSEVFDEKDVAARTQEEYVDLSIGKASIVTSTNEGHYVRHLDADEGLSFLYRPYKCIVEQMDDLSFDLQVKDTGRLISNDGQRDLWNFNVETMVDIPSGGNDLRTTEPRQRGNYRRGISTKTKPLRLFGVVGLWLMATKKNKKFKEADLVYSASNDKFRPSLLWTITEGDISVDLYFVKAPPSAGSVDLDEEPTLETISIMSTKDKSLLRTINILSIERWISSEAYDQVLSVPVGYGCFSKLLDAYADEINEPSFVDLIRKKRSYVNRHSIDNEATWVGRTELEVTATKITAGAMTTDATSGESSAALRSSDTFSVELARTSAALGTTDGGVRKAPFLKLIRWRNSREDKKLVMNGSLRVQYTIDMLRGTCEISQLSADQKVMIKFANGAEFDANIELFKESDDLHFVKVTSANSNKRRLHHYEGTAASKELIGWLRNSAGITEREADRVRVVRSYLMDEDLFELVRITIWLLDDTESNIVESYQIYVIDYREEDGTELAEERVKQFDISYECYLENEAMIQNRDYAWFQLSYPVSQQLIGVVADNAHLIKQIYYSHFVYDISRVPRVEFLLEEDKFKIRSLVLDLPPVEVIFDKTKGTKFVPSSSSGLDHDYIEPDLAHCARVCQTNHCTVMSYCPSIKTCSFSVRPLRTSDENMENTDTMMNFSFTNNTLCDTYQMSAKMDLEQYKNGRITSIIARLQHQNYDVQVALPPPPDEVTLSESESGLSEQEREKAVNDYIQQAKEFLQKGDQVPDLTFAVLLSNNFIFLLPNKFELENDPLSEFGLHDSTVDFDGASVDSSSGYGAGGASANDDDGRVPHFHKAATLSRFNIAELHNVLRPDTKQHVAVHSYTGLTYDQCAMACWDSKCGTFSYCDQGGECILSSAKTLGDAMTLGIIETAADCVVAQRDFLGNFVKFPNVYRPQVYKTVSSEPVMDPSECALNCIAETSFRCMSFQFCSTMRFKNNLPGGECYYQASHHSLNEEAPTQTGCDHYARSLLADFIRLDARRVTKDIVDQLKTSTINDVSVFRCAEMCSNELLDCSAFQYCLNPKSSPTRECLTIESKITPGMLKMNDKTNEITIVDESDDGGSSLKSGDYLTYDVDCQVFAMRKESSQAHLRDLAFGDLISLSDDKPDKPKQEATGSNIFGSILLYVITVAVSASITYGIIILASKSDVVRQRIERFRVVIGM